VSTTITPVMTWRRMAVFMAIRRAQPAAGEEIHVILNWSEELRRALGR
jgi:hypothetical protein